MDEPHFYSEVRRIQPQSTFYFGSSVQQLLALPPGQSSSGDEGIRTPDLRRAKAALSQLSYIPEITRDQVGLSGLEPETSPLSEARSNQLS